jgi:anti-sigma regulatory factor (Ser/Thr protein kinase)
MSASLSVELPRTPDAPFLARRALDDLQGQLAPAVVPDLRLLVSELVTNSVTHAALSPEQNVDLKVVTRPGRVRVEVADPGSHFNPEGRRPTPGSESRWGLFLLNEMADRWGIDRRDPGKTVWFEVDL